MVRSENDVKPTKAAFNIWASDWVPAMVGGFASGLAFEKGWGPFRSKFMQHLKDAKGTAPSIARTLIPTTGAVGAATLGSGLNYLHERNKDLKKQAGAEVGRLPEHMSTLGHQALETLPYGLGLYLMHHSLKNSDKSDSRQLAAQNFGAQLGTSAIAGGVLGGALMRSYKNYSKDLPKVVAKVK